MGMNIKSDRVHDLAREAARRAGTSQTSVIEQALERFLDELDAESATARLRSEVAQLLADVDDRLDDDARARLTTDDLYDEQGLPA